MITNTNISVTNSIHKNQVFRNMINFVQLIAAIDCNVYSGYKAEQSMMIKMSAFS